MAMRRTTSMENAIPCLPPIDRREDDRYAAATRIETRPISSRYSTHFDYVNTPYGGSSEFSPYFGDSSRFRFPQYQPSTHTYYEYRPLMVDSLAPALPAPQASTPITPNNLTRTLSHSLDSLTSEHATEHLVTFNHSDGMIAEPSSMSVSSIHPVLMDAENQLHYEEDNLKEELPVSPNSHKILSNRTNANDLDRIIYTNLDVEDNNNPQTRVNFAEELSSFDVNGGRPQLEFIIEEDSEFSRGRQSRSGTQTSEDRDLLNVGTVHRRAVSDQCGSVNDSESQSSQRISLRDGRPASTRSAGGRCHSQIVQLETDRDKQGIAMGNGTAEIMRKQSSCSNLSLQEEEEQAEELADSVPTEPPPVVLQRKVSSASSSKNSWKNHFPSVGVSSHAVYSAQSIPHRGIAARSTLTESSKPRERNVKKDKSGSDTFSFSSLLFKNRSKSRPALADTIANLESKALDNGTGANRRSTASTDSMTSLHKHSFDGLPDHIRRLGETEELPESESTDQIPDRHLQFLTDERWHRFDLFGERYNDTWHEKHRDELSKLSSKYVKKQDSIYELVNIEKQHCANLIFLQFGYRERLMREKILSTNGVNELIPDVLDALLSFHLNLLTRLVDRLQASKHVHTISDIITEEISDSAKGMTRCIDAYTLFGLAKERAESNFNRLTKENSKFISFLQRCYEEPIYKRFDFKPLLAKIIGRPTKYTLILENILKHEKEFSQELDYTKTAIQATKLFAARINNSLCMSQMLNRWENIRREIDVTSRTSIYITDAHKVNSVVPHEFTKEDLSLPIHAGPGTRQLRCIGDVYLKQTSEKIPLFMALFDDVLVCLYRKNGKYYFLQDQGVFPVYSLIVRVQERSHSVFLVVSGKPKLLEIEFFNRSDKDLWVSALEAAINSARTEVRLTEETVDKAETRRAKGQQAAEDKWLDELDKLFRERETQETQLSNYLESRFLFFDSLRTHMATLPFKTRADISDRVKQVVRQKFRELRLVRTTPLNKLVDRISASRDADLWSYFNDKADCAVDASDSQDSDESGAGSAEGGLRRPRRIQTFHGTIPESSSRASDRSLRRHTTVPRMHSSGIPIEDDSQEGGSWTGGYTFMHGVNEEARHAADRLAKEVVHLRREHSKLMDETAQMRIRLELLSRTRGAPSAAAPSDSMEQLRRKEQILRDKNQQLEIEKKYIEEERLQLEKDRQDLERREADLTAKWEAFHQTQSQVACQMNSSIPSDGYFHSMSAASSPSPASIAMTGRMPIASSPISRNTSMREPPRTPNNSFMSPALENLKEKSEIRTKRK